MKLVPLTIAIAILFSVVGCQTPGGGGGGKKRYEYPSAKLSSQKRVRGASMDGRFVILNDGSTWNIDWGDASKARTWSAGDRVSVILTRSSSFPYTLIRQADGQRVAARFGRKLD